MMKRFITIAILACLVTLILSMWSLPARAASKLPSINGQVAQGHFSLNGKGNVAISPDPQGLGEFDAVAAVSANDVWAVGDGIGTLIEHWNGTRWSLVKSPSPGTAFNNLYGVAAISTNDVWAVGSYSNNQQNPNVQTLIEHWNGTQWSVVSSPSPGTGFNSLNGVVALSANNVWAVGGYDYSTLVEHWNGTQWSVVTSPSPGSDAILNGVAAVSASNVWVVGYYSSGGSSRSGQVGSQTLIEQWNGSQWSVISSPNSTSQYNDLTGIAAVSGNANDIWAVGNSNNGSQTLIEQWNGSQWSIVASPNPGSSSNSLNAVAALSASNVWAVGYEESGTNSVQTLTEQWNGSQWSVVTSPDAGAGNNRLNGVATLSASDIWAVGFFVNGASFQTLAEQWNGTKWSVVISPDQIGDGNLSGIVTVSASDIWAVGSDDSGTLIEQWNGTKWSVVTSPSPESSGMLNGVAAVSSNDLWAVGSYFTNSGIQQTLIEQWNGTKWSVVASPNSTSQDALTGVAAVSASNIWAVGYSVTNSGTNQTLIEHWNGSQWSIVASPNPGAQGNSLNAVVAVSANDLWAVGFSYNSSFVQQTLIEQWNGTKWNVVSSPNPGSFQDVLTGVTAVSASNIWAVGFQGNGNNGSQTLIEQWNGSQWSVVASPNATTGGSFLNGVAATSASNVWAVGNSGEINGNYQTLTEHWNGTQWSIVTSSNPGSISSLLNAVTAVSASDAWAVGQYSNTNYASQSLVEQWNGSVWSQIPSPNAITQSTSHH